MKPIIDNFIFDFSTKNCIYKGVRIDTGQIYIGKTEQSIYTRAQQHISEALNKDRNNKLANAIRKYGPDIMRWTIIDALDNQGELSKEEKQLLDDKEKYYIKLYESNDRYYGLNLTNGGERTEFTDEMKERLSASAKHREYDWRQLTISTASISEETAIKITNLLSEGKKPQEVADILSISTYIVNGIYYNHTWKHLGFVRPEKKFITHTKYNRKRKTKNIKHDEKLIIDIKSAIVSGMANKDIADLYNADYQLICDIKYHKRYNNIAPELNDQIYK